MQDELQPPPLRRQLIEQLRPLGHLARMVPFILQTRKNFLDPPGASDYLLKEIRQTPDAFTLRLPFRLDRIYLEFGRT